MKRKKLLLNAAFLVLSLTLSACASGTDEPTPKEETNLNEEESPNENAEMDHSDMDHGDMDHSSSGDVPEGLKEAENPIFEIGSKAMITDGHMVGMEGAEATIVGAYDTIAYAISYTPTTGGERVSGHKWVIHEELTDVGEEPLEPGTEIVTNAGHMAGMEGTTAVINYAEKITVYMINFVPTTGGEKVVNHKWVTESELSPL